MNNICCPEKSYLDSEDLISTEKSDELEALFKVLANRTRLRMLHALFRAKEMCVNDIAATLAMKPQAISNQLVRLVDKGMVASRREGNNIFYKIIDPCVPALLDRGMCLLEESGYRDKYRIDTNIWASGASKE